LKITAEFHTESLNKKKNLSKFYGGLIQSGYEVPRMILLRDLKGPYDLIVIKTCLCMFQLAPITISAH